jgi:hypothetical protein
MTNVQRDSPDGHDIAPAKNESVRTLRVTYVSPPSDLHDAFRREVIRLRARAGNIDDVLELAVILSQ